MMRRAAANCVLFLLAIAGSVPGCSGIPKSFKASTLDNMYPILSDEQYALLESLNSDDDINRFLEGYWQENDPTPNTKENEFKSEYLRRLEHSNFYFPDRRGWGRSERKRIYLTQGPPLYVERYETIKIHIGSFSIIKAMEVWLYLTPEGIHSLPLFGNNSHMGQKRFIFADVTGSGFYTLLTSTEDYADIDVRILSQP